MKAYDDKVAVGRFKGLIVLLIEYCVYAERQRSGLNRQIENHVETTGNGQFGEHKQINNTHKLWLEHWFNWMCRIWALNFPAHIKGGHLQTKRIYPAWDGNNWTLPYCWRSTKYTEPTDISFTNCFLINSMQHLLNHRNVCPSNNFPNEINQYLLVYHSLGFPLGK